MSPRQVLSEFLMQYRRTPLPSGYSPSELLNGRRIRTRLNVLMPSPPHILQNYQNSNYSHDDKHTAPTCTVRTPCYALYCGPKQTREPKWVPGVVTKVFGARSFNVRITSNGAIWRRHIEQFRPRHTDTLTHRSALPVEGKDIDNPINLNETPPLLRKSQRKRKPRRISNYWLLK